VLDERMRTLLIPGMESLQNVNEILFTSGHLLLGGAAFGVVIIALLFLTPQLRRIFIAFTMGTSPHNQMADVMKLASVSII